MAKKKKKARKKKKEEEASYELVEATSMVDPSSAKWVRGFAIALGLGAVIGTFFLVRRLTAPKGQ